jgi:hypothetical protein
MRGTMSWARAAIYRALSHYGDMTFWLPQAKAGVAQEKES